MLKCRPLVCLFLLSYLFAHYEVESYTLSNIAETTANNSAEW